MPKLPDHLARRLREAGVAEPGWHLRKLKAAAGEGGDLDAMVERVCAGEPVHRVIGYREFHGLDLALSRETLEPRDDTEELIALVVSTLMQPHSGGFRYEDYEKAFASLNRLTKPYRFADLGTGSGAVALALLGHLLNATCVATDVSKGALAIATQNAQTARAKPAPVGNWTLHPPDPRYTARLELSEGSWLEPLEGTFDFIVSNPPYIATAVIPTLDPSVRDHDPHLALDGGADGLDAYRAILRGAAAYLREGGFVVLEIGYDQRDAVTALAHTHGWRLFDERRDMGGHVRALAFRPV